MGSASIRGLGALSLVCLAQAGSIKPAIGEEYNQKIHCTLIRKEITIIIDGEMCGVTIRNNLLEIWAALRPYSRSMAIDGRNGWTRSPAGEYCLQNKQNDAMLCYVKRDKPIAP